jgi:hypothetical protein
MSDPMEALKKYKPPCSCFDDDSDVLYDRLKTSVKLAHEAGTAFIMRCAEEGFCRQALPFVMEDIIINIVTRIVAENRKSVIASDSARLESLAHIVDLEKRLTEKINELYACARSMEAEEKALKEDVDALMMFAPRNGETLQ